MGDIQHGAFLPLAERSVSPQFLKFAGNFAVTDFNNLAFDPAYKSPGRDDTPVGHKRGWWGLAACNFTHRYQCWRYASVYA